MSYVGVAIISGLLFGIAVAAAKHFFIWRPYAKGRTNKLYGLMAISMAVNILTLLVVYLARNYWPYSFSWTIIGVAIGLSGGSQILSYITNASQKKAAASAGK